MAGSPLDKLALIAAERQTQNPPGRLEGGMTPYESGPLYTELAGPPYNPVSPGTGAAWRQHHGLKTPTSFGSQYVQPNTEYLGGTARLFEEYSPSPRYSKYQSAQPSAVNMLGLIEDYRQEKEGIPGFDSVLSEEAAYQKLGDPSKYMYDLETRLGQRGRGEQLPYGGPSGRAIDNLTAFPGAWTQNPGPERFAGAGMGSGRTPEDNIEEMGRLANYLGGAKFGSGF